MEQLSMDQMCYYEDIGDKYGWVAPLTDEDREYFTLLRSVYKRYNIIPSKATELEHEFVIKVTESEFYPQRAQA